MQIKTDMPARSIRAAIAVRQQFAVRHAADTMLEQAAASEGHDEYDADLVTIAADLVSSDGETFAGVLVWVDRCEAAAKAAA
jgi:hypothetical protein